MTRIIGSIAAMALFAIMGCGKATTYPVHGRVVFADGKPLTAGTVEFLHKSAEGKAINARAGIDEKGEFLLKTNGREGAVAGEHQVIVLPFRPDESDSTKKVPPDQIDPIYSSYETSQLRATVKAEPQNDVTLQVSPLK